MKLFFIISSFTLPVTLLAQQDLKLWYNKPAEVWTEALPVGNGRIGAMVFGRTGEELVQLNEATLWSGGPVKQNVNPDAPLYLPQVREALFRGDYEKANELVKKIQGLFSQSYMPLADLLIKQKLSGNETTAYYRDLDLQDAVASTRFADNGINYKREIFISAPDQVMVVRLTSSASKAINISVSARSQLPSQVSRLNSTELLLKGKAAAQADPNYFNVNKEPIIYNDPEGCRGMRFAVIVKAVSKDGNVNATDNEINVTHASEVLLFISAATSFNGFDKCPDKDGKDELTPAKNDLKKATGKSFTALFSAHKTDHKKYFSRVSLQLNGGSAVRSKLPTDERIETYNKEGNDPGLEALYFQYGRYLLIGSSRTRHAPANLQGIWNKELRAPWSSNYTTNINVQMNYWPAEAANLSEMTLPLFDLVGSLAVTGKRTAREFYNAPGWVTHHNADIWALSNPVGDTGKGDPKWANWAMGANWLTRHLWEHYLYTKDTGFLKNKAYPLMKGAAVFSLNWLVPDSNGYLVTAPSTSPENDYYYDGKKVTALTIASTMDMGIIRDLFENVVKASSILKTDKPFRDSVKAALARLYPFKIGSKGNLQEWYKDFEDVDPHHRHVSHLYALHPAELISPVKTPELAQAAKRTLELRGDDGTGWSLAWKVNFWARLLNGDKAHKLYSNLLRLTKEKNATYNSGGGAYANLFDAHPPFQIDGNFAGAAGLIEMLLQSHNDEMFLLPALPGAWPKGFIKGIVARGNYVLNISWENNKLKNADLLSRSGGECTIRTHEPVKISSLGIRSKPAAIGHTITFNSIKGKTYRVTPQ